MGKPKTTVFENGKKMHYSVGALIERNVDGYTEYFLIDRNVPPYGWAGVAGHIDEGEMPVKALMREVKEECNLDVIGYELTAEEKLRWNECSKGVGIHYWYLYRCMVEGDVEVNKREVKDYGWYSVEQIDGLTLEKVWEYWFKKLKIL